MAKTMTFAVLHFSVAFLVAYALTGSFIIGGAVALIEPAVNTVVFYFHEKFWRAFDKNKAAEEGGHGLRFWGHHHHA